jgi:pimeloyl-ACP methyl ester carboxylesterase
MNLFSTMAAGLPRSDRPFRTLGGLWGWGDMLLVRDWRLQQHATRDEFRLLDGQNRCHAQGDEATCRNRLEELRDEYDLHVAPGPSVVVLHGIMRTRYCMMPLSRHLAREGFASYNVAYPAARWSIGRSAQQLRGIVEGLAAGGPVHLVGYSLGGLVIRQMLADGPTSARLGRCVFIGTPNQGAEKADRFATWRLFRWLFGPAGPELCTLQGHGIIHRLPACPNQEVGIIAGGTGGRGYMPWLSGDNDFTVTVASTHLPGERDFRLVRAGHASLPMVRDTLRHTAAFLKTGQMAD